MFVCVCVCVRERERESVCVIIGTIVHCILHAAISTCGPVQCCAFALQGKAVVKFVDAIAEKSLRTTVAMTAGRGRGKSAALGLSIAAAVAYQ